VDVVLRDRNGFAATTSGSVLSTLEAAPPGALLFFADAGCTIPAPALALPAGATTASFHVRGASPGTAAIRLVPDLLPTVERAVEVLP
jgi:hypothetical protein